MRFSWKKLFTLFLVTMSVALVTACDDSSENDDNEGEELENGQIEVLSFPHLDGYGKVVERDMPILFEYEMRDYVKYQVAFVSCTCRPAKVDYWSVVYYEIDKNTGEVLTMSFDEDGEGKYTAGLWGDSDPIPEVNLTQEDFEEDFVPWLVGQDKDSLEGINIFYDDTPEVYSDEANDKDINEPDMIDAYAGASVSTNNYIRVTKTLLDYHYENYID